jgi:hypothetical protein
VSIGAELSGLIRVDGGAARVSAGVPGDRAVSDRCVGDAGEYIEESQFAGVDDR